jgi:hypothetical protein
MKRIFLVVTLAFFLISLLLVPGCDQQRMRWEVSYQPKMINDGVGGVISLYDILTGKTQRDIYIQRINAGGQKIWGERGTLVTSVSMESVAFVYMKIVSDGHSGAIVTQGDLAYDLSTRAYRITRVGTDGTIIWQKPVTAAHQLVSDNNGGAIIASVKGTVLRFDKLDATGNPAWGDEGVSIIRPQYEKDSIKVAGDGIGGVVASWRESPSEPPPSTDTSKPWRTQKIMAQRIDAEGQIKWGEGGVVLFTSS